MASANRATSEAVELVRALEEAPYKFNFFQAIRLIEAGSPGLDRAGTGRRPSKEAVRLGQEPSLAFAPSMLASFTPGKGDSADYLAGYFFGLFGPNGPLPLHLTEYARDREKVEKDGTFRAFADIFHNRMLSLFYRAWAEARPTVQMDRPDQDQFATYVGATFGMASPGLRNRDALDDHAKLFMAGRLSQQSRPAEGLQAMLEELFLVPMVVEQYVGEWMTLPKEAELKLGSSPTVASLGETATLGARVWGGQHKFRIVCGPLSGKDFKRFLPGEQSLEKLCSTVRNYVGDELDWEIRLLLVGDETPTSKLGEFGQLGWTSWIGEKQSDEPADDVILHPMGLVSDTELQ
jgi:type VI secretion system protein ImpH